MSRRFASCTSLLFAALVLAVPAWAAQVQVCHVPPGNPTNFHTITINDNALQAHLAHGDLAGPCFAHCEQLCNDGNPCTIDACDASERCKNDHPPVNCDDGDACTIDSCNPAGGCSGAPKTCQDGNRCTFDSCDPVSGACVFVPPLCDIEQVCNPATGACEGEVNDACNPNPCQNGGTCQASGSGYSCTCASGWTGTNCAEDINECAATPSPCGTDCHGSLCSNYPGGYFCENPDWLCF
jgi:hypothetical protein